MSARGRPGRADYNEWGEITHNAVLKSGQRELDLVKRFATHDYDAVLGLYYAKARFYDAENRRFVEVDPIKGSVTNPLSLVPYVYCADNPLRWVDPLGLMISENPVLRPYLVSDGGTSSNTKSISDPKSDYMDTPGCSDKIKELDDVLAVGKKVDPSGNYGFCLYLDPFFNGAIGQSTKSNLDFSDVISKTPVLPSLGAEVGFVKIGGMYEHIEWHFSTISADASFGLDPKTLLGAEVGARWFQLGFVFDLPIQIFDHTISIGINLDLLGLGKSLIGSTKNVKMGGAYGAGFNVSVSAKSNT